MVPRRTALLLGILLLALPAWPAGRAAKPRVYDLIAGGERVYTVAPGDTVWAITGRFTMSLGLLRSWNALADPGMLHPGLHLRVSDRHVVPRRTSDGIVIDVAVRTLYWFRKGKLRARFPIGVGRADWATPPGHYRIAGRREDPVWHVPPSIQKEMHTHGEEVVRVVPPGPDNPLGKYWIQLSAPGYGLHGTNAPASVGKYASHGCMRLLPEHVQRLYRKAPDGTPVDIVYEPVKVARDGSGAIYLEVHRDVLGGKKSELPAVLDLLRAVNLAGAVDPTRVEDAVAHAWGTPEEVSPQARPAGGPAVPAGAIVP